MNDKFKMIKEEGAVFTPSFIVDLMLDSINYKGKKIINKKIMENSFGEGAYLLSILERLFSACKRQNMTDFQIKQQIENNIFGIEKNAFFYEKAIARLNNYLYSQEFYLEINWNLYNDDTLTIWKKFESEMDFVVGNPPYVRIHNLKRNLSDFEFYSGGMIDLYLIFIEISIKMLKANGKLSLITPTSWMNSNFGKKYRDFLFKNKKLDKIIIFGNDFNPFDVGVYTNIFTIRNNKKNNSVYIYKKRDVIQNKLLLSFEKKISIKKIFFNGNFYPMLYLNNLNLNQNFHNINITVKNGLATLLDNFFISDTNDWNLMIPIIKASTNQKKWIIHPYDKNSKLIDLDEIKSSDLYLFEHFKKNKDKLLKRDIRNKNFWYGYGRKQGLKDIWKKKIYINNLFKDKKDIKIGFSKPGTAVYSGFYVLNNNFSFDEIKEILYTEDFLLFSKIFGNYKANGYFSLNSKYLELFLKIKLWEKYERTYN